MEKQVIATLEYYDLDGRVQDHINYTDVQELKNQLEKDLYYGEPVMLTVYSRPGQGPAVTQEWFQKRVCSISAKFRKVYLPGRRAKKKIHKRKEYEAR